MFCMNSRVQWMLYHPGSQPQKPPQHLQHQQHHPVIMNNLDFECFMADLIKIQNNAICTNFFHIALQLPLVHQKQKSHTQKIKWTKLDLFFPRPFVKYQSSLEPILIVVQMKKMDNCIVLNLHLLPMVLGLTPQMVKELAMWGHMLLAINGVNQMENSDRVPQDNQKLLCY